MATELKKVKREYAANESALASLLVAGQWGQAQDTGCIIAVRRDGLTVDAFETRARLAGTTSTTGTYLIGSEGITGITPSGGVSGGTGTLGAMLKGIRDGVILKTPYSASLNTIQPLAVSYVPLILKGIGSQVADLFQVQDASANVLSRYDNAGDFYVSRAGSGSTVGVQIQNTNNSNTSSHARLTLGVGGASGGNPFIRFNISGSTDWAIGADNAASDAFKISQSSGLGTNDYLTISTAGAATFSGAVSTGALSATTGAFSGVLSPAAALTFTGTGSAADWSLWRSAGAGLSLRGGAGSSYDFSILNPAGNYLLRNPTGTSTVEFPGAITLSAETANRLLYLNGSKVASTSNSLTWDGSTFSLTGAQTISSTLGVTGKGTLGDLKISSFTTQYTIPFATNTSGDMGASSSLTFNSATGTFGSDKGTFSGLLTASGSLLINGGSFAAGRIYSNATDGTVITGNAGSSTDLVLQNRSGGAYMTGGSNTQAVTFPGTVGVTGLVSLANNLIFTGTDATIRTNTSDGSDNKRLMLSSAGDVGGSRGAYIQLLGNEFSGAAGALSLSAGDGSDGRIYLTPGNGSVALQINKNGTSEFFGGIASVTSVSGSWYEKGSFTATLTGVSGSVTDIATYVKVGAMVTIHIPAMEGTSNSTSFGLTGIPAAIRPTTDVKCGSVKLKDNGALISNADAYVQLGGAIQFLKNDSATGFTNTGTKGILGAGSNDHPTAFTYMIE